ncbi:LamG domain-containing protein, partial [Patescibacteria group bacterium]|nr:LamG domain-containing protein [Patescibacteria group bacterium]
MNKKLLPLLIILPLLILGSFLLFKSKTAEPTEASVSRTGLTLDLDFGNNDGSATPVVYDSSGWGRHATSTNAQTCNNSFCDFGTGDAMTANATNVFNSLNISYAIKFTPDFAANDGLGHFIIDTNAPRYYIVKWVDNTLHISLSGATKIIAFATYQAYWRVGQENILIVSANDTTNKLNVWLNGTKIVDNEAFGFVNANPTTLYFGVYPASMFYFFDGKIYYLKVWNRLLTDAEVAILSADRETTANTAQRSGATGSSTGTLVGYWTMDTNDYDGTTLLDKSGQGNHGTDTNMDTSNLTQGKINQALDFDGSSEAIDIGTPAISEFTISTPFTLSAWIKPSQTISAFGHIFGRFTDAGGSRYGIHADVSGKFGGVIAGTTGGSYFTSTTVLPIGEWSHLIMTYDGSGNLNGSKLYYNGSFVKAGSSSEMTGNLYSSGYKLCIGGTGSSCNASYRFPGSIDDVRIY